MGPGASFGSLLDLLSQIRVSKQREIPFDRIGPHRLRPQCGIKCIVNLWWQFNLISVSAFCSPQFSLQKTLKNCGQISTKWTRRPITSINSITRSVCYLTTWLSGLARVIIQVSAAT
jgi:hypothetical protein